MIRRTNHLIFAILLIALSMTPMAISVQAQDGSVPPVTHQEAPMVLLCDQMDAEALLYAHEHGLCLEGDSSGEQITPDYTELPGDCGTSYIDVVNMGGGNAVYHAGVRSSQGAIVIVDWYIEWVNWRTSGRGRLSGNQIGLSGDWEYWSPVTYTNTGFVAAYLGGTATLWWGGLCGILGPTDGETIT
jgi:hypothetical protein